MTKVLVTGGGGNAGQAVCALLKQEGYEVRCADMTPGCPTCKDAFVRCDTRTPADVEAAVAGMDAVVHLAAWHCAHVPPVSDATIWAVNVDGTFMAADLSIGDAPIPIDEWVRAFVPADIACPHLGADAWWDAWVYWNALANGYELLKADVIVLTRAGLEKMHEVFA